MVKVNWTETLSNDFKPGYHLAEVKKCAEKKSAAGDPYFNVELYSMGMFGAEGLICFDIIMLDGKGRGLGQAKLKALGFSDKNSDLAPEDLVGRRAWVKVYHDTYEGKQRLKVESVFEPTFSCGYWPEASPPEGAVAAKAVDDESVPF